MKTLYLKFTNFFNYKIPPGLKVLDYLLIKLYNLPKNKTISKDDFKKSAIDDEYGKLVYKFFNVDRTTSFNELSLVEENFDNAIEYLEQKNYIKHKSGIIKFTFKGIVKIENGGFTKEFKNKKVNDNLQRIFWFISLPAFIVSFTLLLLKFFS